MDGEDRADGHVVIHVGRAVQGIEEKQVLARLVFVRDGHEGVFFLGSQAGQAPGVVGDAGDGQVGEAVQLHHRLALDIGVVRAAEDFGQPGPRGLAGDDLAGQGDVVEQVGQRAGGLGVEALLLENMPLNGADGRRIGHAASLFMRSRRGLQIIMPRGPVQGRTGFHFSAGRRSTVFSAAASTARRVKAIGKYRPSAPIR